MFATAPEIPRNLTANKGVGVRCWAGPRCHVLDMTNWPKDNTAAKNAFYGDFRKPNWGNQYLIRIHAPYMMYYAKKPTLSGILVNKQCAPGMMAAFSEIWEKCNHDQKQVDKTGASDYGGCYNPRPIRGSNNPSNHSWACAIDLSPGSNGFNMKSTLSTIVIDAFKRQGARWGGDYKGRKDPMHLEFVSP